MVDIDAAFNKRSAEKQECKRRGGAHVRGVACRPEPEHESVVLEGLEEMVEPY